MIEKYILLGYNLEPTAGNESLHENEMEIVIRGKAELKWMHETHWCGGNHWHNSIEIWIETDWRTEWGETSLLAKNIRPFTGLWG